MIFASFEFLVIFLPVFFAAYYAAPARYRNGVILAFSWIFYAWWRVDFLALLIAVTLGTYLLSRAIAAACIGSIMAGRLMVAGVAANLAVLAYFKYANFGVATFNQLLTAAGVSHVGWSDVLLPVGLSFYVLQSVSYLIDVNRGVVPVSRSFIDYAAYKAIFAQLIAGPIVRYAEIASEMQRRHYSLAQFGAGARIFMIGFAMKAVVADTLSPLSDAAFALSAPTLVDGWIGMVAYSYQLFFDFAGYSTMAIGLARMMGFHFPVNFNDPYLATSIQDFWRRWHMTLSRFLVDYLYIPLGGSRRGAGRTHLNLIIVMAVGGLWHGASWNYVIWGCWHGALLSLHRLWSQRRWLPAMPLVAGHMLTMIAVMLGLVVFRAKTLAAAMVMLRGIAGVNGLRLSNQLAWQATPDRLCFVAVAVARVYVPMLRRHLPPRPAFAPPVSFVAAAGTLAAFCLAIVLLYSRAAVPFLYFQF